MRVPSIALAVVLLTTTFHARAASPSAENGAVLNFSSLGGPVSPVKPVLLTSEDTLALGIIQAWARDAWSKVRPRSVAPEQVEARELLLAEESELLYGFTTNYPGSPWTPSIQVQLGQRYRSTGRISRALALWDSAWESSKLAKTGRAKVVADSALAQYVDLLCSLGRYEKLTELFADTRGRTFPFGADAELYLQSLEAYKHMGINPGKSYRCGTYALANVATALFHTNSFARALVKIPSPATGFTLKQLTEFSDALGMGLVPVNWGETRQLVVPSVVHWSENHYAAITERHGNWFTVVDPTFGRERRLRLEDIVAEASGYFLVPAASVPRGWRQADPTERSAIYGRGYDTVFDDWFDQPPKCSGPGAPGWPVIGGSGCQGCLASGTGMPVWTASEPYLNLWLFDTPLNYQPALGPELAVELMYRQRGLYATIFPYLFGSDGARTTQVGNNWCLPWRSAVDSFDDGQGGATPRVLTPAGATTDFSLPASFAMSEPAYFNNTRFERVVDSGTQEVQKCIVHHPDGSRDEYGFAATNSDGSVSRWDLTSHVDSAGRATQIEYFGYDPAKTESIIKRIIDPDGHELAFSYTSLDVNGDGSVIMTNFVSQITDWTGRNVKFKYNTNTLDLIEIVDAAGITNRIAYDENHWPTNLVTPYGTTAFEHSNYRGGHFEARNITITEPNGGKQRFRYESSDITPISDSMDPLGNGYTVPSGTPLSDSFATGTGDRNSYHWDARNYDSLSSDFKNDPENFIPSSSDCLRGRARHWLGGDWIPTHTLGSEREPSPDGSVEGQITWYNYAGKSSSEYQGTQVLPAVIARVMPDGTTAYQYFERNDIGAPTLQVDKWVAGGSAQYRTNTFTYDADFNLLNHYGPDGALTVGYGYSASYPHQPIRMTNALNEITFYTYDTSQRLITTTTPSGLVSSNTYGSDGYLQMTIDSYGNTTVRTNQYTWLYNHPRIHIDERGLSTTNTYDALGRLTQVDYPDGTYEQDIFTIGSAYPYGTGQLSILDRTGHRDRMGLWTYYSWTANRQLATVTDPRGFVTLNDYCDCGSLNSVTRAYGTPFAETTSYVYGQNGKLLETWFPDSTIKSNIYDLPGRLVITADALGRTTNTFDNLNRLSAVSNAFGQAQAITYDVNDRVITATDANGVTITNYYDNLNRLTARGYPDNGVESWAFTANVPSATGYTNQLGNVWLYSYDPAGRKTNEVALGMYTNKFTYAAAGDLLTLVDGRNYTTSWKYDEFGRVTNKTDQASVEILRYKYDPNGRLTNRWSLAKGNTAYLYDPSGNLTNVDYPSGTSDVSFAYDPLNRVTNMVDAVGTTKYTYRPGGQMWTEDGPWATDTVTNTYVNRLRAELDLQQPTGLWTNAFGYDSAARLTNVTSKAGVFSYTLGGTSSASPLIKKLLLPNTSYITNGYDSNARLLFTLLNNSSGTTLDSALYGYNMGNQRTAFTNATGTYARYSYDNIGQLKVTRTTNSSGTVITGETKGYAYDAGWNLKTRTNSSSGSTTAFAVDSLNQLTTVASDTYSYDGNGNLTNYNHPFPFYYEYDAENRLTLAADYWYGSPQTETQFIYDGLGRLRRKVGYAWDTMSGYWVQTSETRYIYDGMRVIQERNLSNVPTVSYTRGTDLSGTLEGAGGIGGLLARSDGYSSGNWTSHNFYHADGNGNITYLVNSSQTLAASYRYDAYGNTISSGGTLASANAYRFSSKEYHSGSGLYYYGYRWYDPNTQRWPNRDPIGERGGINLYTFGFNSPINVVDFLGLEPGDIGVPRPGSGGRGQNCMGHALCDSGKWEQGDTRTKDNPWPEEKYLKDKGCREIKCGESCDSAKKEQKVKLYEWKKEDQFHIVRQNGDKWSGKIGAGPIYDFPDPDKHTSEAYKIKPEDWKATCWCCPCKK